MKCFDLPRGRTLVVVEGDITRLKVDAIVNPANSLMIMGGGVAGAIKRAGGGEIEEEAMRKAPVPVGEAIATSAGGLPSKAVIHAPTMERPAMRIGLENAEKATLAALRVASQLGYESIAFPAMGAGVGGLSVYDAFHSMARLVRDYGGARPRMVVFVAWGLDSYREALRAVEDSLGSEGSTCRGLQIYL